MAPTTQLLRFTEIEKATILAALENFATDLRQHKIHTLGLEGEMLTDPKDVSALWTALNEGDCNEERARTPFADTVQACANGDDYHDVRLLAAMGLLSQFQARAMDAMLAVSAAQRGVQSLHDLGDAAVVLAAVEPLYAVSVDQVPA